MNGQFSTLDEFWPFYLSQHQNRFNRPSVLRAQRAGHLSLPLLSLRADLRMYLLTWSGEFDSYGR